MQVRDIMTSSVECCTPGDTAQKAAQIMNNSETGAVPVIKSIGEPKVIGMITDRDLCLKIVAAPKNPVQVKGEELVNDQVIACHADDDVKDAADMMAINQVRRLPVLDDDDLLVGIVSIGDLSRSLAIDSDDSGEVLATISDPDDGQNLGRGQRK